MVAKKPLESNVAVATFADGLGEAIDPHELRQVLLGMRELISQTRCQTLVRELRVAHDRISEIKIADRVSIPCSSPTCL